MKLQNLQGLELIEGQQIRQIAQKADVTRQYVAKILKGQSPMNTITAKAIYAAARALNDSMKKGFSKADEKLQPINEND